MRTADRAGFRFWAVRRGGSRGSRCRSGAPRGAPPIFHKVRDNVIQRLYVSLTLKARPSPLRKPPTCAPPPGIGVPCHTYTPSGAALLVRAQFSCATNDAGRPQQRLVRTHGHLRGAAAVVNRGYSQRTAPGPSRPGGPAGQQAGRQGGRTPTGRQRRMAGAQQVQQAQQAQQAPPHCHATAGRCGPLSAAVGRRVARQGRLGTCCARSGRGDLVGRAHDRAETERVAVEVPL